MVRYKLFFAIFFFLSGCAQLAAPHIDEAAAVPKQSVTSPQPPGPILPLVISTTVATPPTAPFIKTEVPPVVIPPEMAAAALTAITKEQGVEHGDVWQRIRSGFAMPEMKSPLIARHQQWYVSRPDYVTRMTERAQRYLYFIVGEVEKRGMPTEIALLPMIESAFNPGAYSTARASGIWQFIPSTGKSFGMQQNWWYDGRRNIISATNGALDYLQKLHDMFGDWELALAAYNCGENAVQRAQARNRKHNLPTNYTSLKLPSETRNYLPKLLAVKNIISQPDRFGLMLQPIANQPYFAPVVTARHIDVKLAAEFADITLEEFLALNPAHNRPVILQENADVLLLPIDKVGTFRANLEQHNESLVSWQAYQSKKGERLDQLAPRFGISLETLRSINGLSPRAKLSDGRALLVPLNGEGTKNEFEAFNTHLVPYDLSLSSAIRHTVRKGDTLSSIARRYHVSVAKLKSWNNGVKILRPGQHVYVVRPGKSGRLIKSDSKKKKRSNVKRTTYSR